MKRCISLLFLALFCVGLFSGTALAADRVFLIDDQAGLLSKEEQEQLRNRYADLTNYTSAAFVTTDYVSGSTAAFAKSYVKRNFTGDAAIVFVIDLDNRQLYIYSNRKAVGMVSAADARAITDNIYTYATKGDYFTCADAAFSQILTRCQGGRIARPVKHITNALIAVVAGILINFYVSVLSRFVFSKNQASPTEMWEMAILPQIVVGTPILIKTERHNHSSGSGGSGGGGGGGGGGGHGF